MKLIAIIEDTFREAMARKTMIGFFSISTFILLISLITAIFIDGLFTPAAQAGSVAQISPDSVEKFVRYMQAGMTGFIHFAALFLSIFATASIIPHTIEKGSIDLLLSKPVSRSNILAGKFLGSGLIVFLNVAYFVICLWLIFSIKTGYWNFSFPLVILPITFSFLVLYASMMLIGLLSRSSALTIIILYAFLYIVSPFLQNRETFLFRFVDNEAIKASITFIYHILPKPGDISDFAAKLVLHENVLWTPLWTSALFGVVMYALTVYLFRKKDF